MKFSLFSEKWVGLDVQPEGIRLVCARRYAKKYILEHAITEPHAVPIFEANKIKRWDVLSLALSELVQLHRLQGLPTITQVPVDTVWIEQIKLAAGLSDEVMQAEISAHIKRELLPLPEELAVDFTLKLPVKNNQVDVYCTAIHQAYLSHFTECVQAAGLTLQIVDLDIYCLKRLLPEVRKGEVVMHAGVYFSGQVAILFVYNSFSILQYKKWNVETVEAFASQLQIQFEMLQVELGTPFITNYYLWCSETHKEWLLNQAFFQEKNFSWINLFHLFQLSSAVKPHFFMEHVIDFTIVCGAIRRIGSKTNGHY